jgi:hypothetical protein
MEKSEKATTHFTSLPFPSLPSFAASALSFVADVSTQGRQEEDKETMERADNEWKAKRNIYAIPKE